MREMVWKNWWNWPKSQLSKLRETQILRAVHKNHMCKMKRREKSTPCGDEDASKIKMLWSLNHLSNIDLKLGIRLTILKMTYKIIKRTNPDRTAQRELQRLQTRFEKICFWYRVEAMIMCNLLLLPIPKFSHIPCGNKFYMRHGITKHCYRKMCVSLLFFFFYFSVSELLRSLPQQFTFNYLFT